MSTYLFRQKRFEESLTLKIPCTTASQIATSAWSISASPTVEVDDSVAHASIFFYKKI
jgi:hypothetical protein